MATLMVMSGELCSPSSFGDAFLLHVLVSMAVLDGSRLVLLKWHALFWPTAGDSEWSARQGCYRWCCGGVDMCLL